MDGLFTLIAFLLGFIIAQVVKCVILLIQAKKRQGKINFSQVMRQLVKSGGMPSGHAASFTAATLYLGLSQGFTSPIFALSACITLIVIYDAINVRYAVGEQGKILAQLIKKQKYILPKPQIIEGHTISQVIVGALIGLIVGWLVFIVFY